jgi:hypothetical protein
LGIGDKVLIARVAIHKIRGKEIVGELKFLGVYVVRQHGRR